MTEKTVFDGNNSVYTQYQKSPTLLKLSESLSTALTTVSPKNHEELYPIDEFLNYNFLNIDTCGEDGLLNWGRILNRTNVVKSSAPNSGFGFKTNNKPYTEGQYPEVFNKAPFYFESSVEPGEYTTLTARQYRQLLKFTYLVSINNCSIKQINDILQFYFKNRGVCYCYEIYDENDNAKMKIKYVFEFQLENWEKNLFLYVFNVLPTPMCVSAEYSFAT